MCPKKKQYNFLDVLCVEEEENIEVAYDILDYSPEFHYKHSVIEHIAGFVSKKIMKSFKCMECKEVIVNKNDKKNPFN